jgi:Domain of unknown function (DUF1906)
VFAERRDFSRVFEPRPPSCNTPPAAGLAIVSCYQYAKYVWPDPSDFTRGYDGGVADAQTTLRLHSAAVPGRRRFFSVDEDIDLTTSKSVAVEWIRGINSVLGVGRTDIASLLLRAVSPCSVPKSVPKHVRGAHCHRLSMRFAEELGRILTEGPGCGLLA